ERLEAAQDGDGARIVADEDAFGDLELQPGGREPRLQQHRVDQARQVAVTELHRRQVDGDLERVRPRCRLAAGLAQRPFADLEDATAPLRQRDEDAGRHQAARRVAPAQQRLEAGDLAADRRRLWLIVQRELVVLQRREQLVLQRALLAQPLVHVGLEETGGAASV